jgi:hypothetical protein
MVLTSFFWPSIQWQFHLKSLLCNSDLKPRKLLLQAAATSRQTELDQSGAGDTAVRLKGELLLNCGFPA